MAASKASAPPVTEPSAPPVTEPSAPPVTEPSAPPVTAAATPPATVRAAALVLAIEVAGILLASLLAGIDAATGKSYHTASGIALTIIGAGTVVALGFVAAGLARGRRWSRTPALLTQLFTGIVGISLVEGGRYDWGICALVLAVAGFVLLFAPPSMRTLAAGRPAERSGPAR